ncbi:Uncharacterised protein [uncultured archaeon]|nr:Uncharacterised protein [uncultured archaeon]
MQIGPLIYVVLVGIVAIAALALTGYISLGNPLATSTVTTTAGNATTASTTIAANATTLPTTSVFLNKCQSKNATEIVPAGDFSSGTYGGWHTTGPGFGSAPMNISYANSHGAYYGAPWRGYDGNFAATNYQVGLSVQTGTLSSGQFEVTEPFLNFKIISPSSDQIYVEILQGSKSSKYWYNTYAAPGNINASTTFVNASIPLLDTSFFCQNVSIRVVAGAIGTTSNLNYIAVGDFYLSRIPRSTPGILVNQSFT